MKIAVNLMGKFFVGGVVVVTADVVDDAVCYNFYIHMMRVVFVVGL